MGMGRIQLGVVNSRIRQLFQKYYELGVIKRHLDRNQIDLAGKTILDAGCGSGYSSEIILQEFQPKDLYAFDVAPEQIELVKGRELPLKAFVGDIAKANLAPDRFDAVFTFGVFHHVPDWHRALEEMNRVLKPKGVLLGGELTKEESVGFEWGKFVADVEKAGFQMVEDEGIYLGYFRSFMCIKPDASGG